MHIAGDFRDLPGEVKRIVPGIGIGLQVGAVVLQERQGRIAGSRLGERVDDERRSMAVVLGLDPELRFIGLAPGRIVVLQRQGGIVGIDVPGIEHLEHHPPVQPLEELGAVHQPLGHQGMGELDPEAGETPGDAIQRQPSANLLTMR